jgi:hypothetical protein
MEHGGGIELLVPDAVQREVLHRSIRAPGCPYIDETRVPCLQRTASPELALRCARDGRNLVVYDAERNVEANP